MYVQIIFVYVPDIVVYVSNYREYRTLFVSSVPFRQACKKCVIRINSINPNPFVRTQDSAG